MNIEDMTIKQFKELQSMFHAPAEKPHFNAKYIEQYVIVRTRSEGVNAGVVVLADETGVVLKDARRLWYHKPADPSESWFEGVANHGLGEGSKTAPAVAEKSIVGEPYSITPCTSKAEESIRGAKPHAQS